MGIICCQKNHPINNILKVNNDKIESSINNSPKSNQINQSIIRNTLVNKITLKKKIFPNTNSEKTINRESTTVNNVNFFLQKKMKVKNERIDKRRKTSSISMHSSFKNQFMIQKKVSDDPFNYFTSSSREKIYQLPPNKTLLKYDEEEKYKDIDDEEEFEFEKENDNENDNEENIKKEKYKNSKNSTMDKNFGKMSSNDKSNKHKLIKEIDRDLSEKQKKLLIDILTYNEIIDSEMTESFINMILNSISYKRLKDNVIFFDQNKNEDIFYIIEKGKLEYGIDNEIYQLSKLNGIGTQALLKYKNKTCYIKTIGRTYLFVLPLGNYRKMVGELERKRNEEKYNYLKKHFFFCNIEESKLRNLVSLSKKVFINEKTILLEEDSLSNKIYYIISGCVNVIKNNIIIKTINEENIFGEICLFNQIESFYEYSAEMNSILIEISYIDFFHCLNNESIKNIMEKLFDHAIKNDEFLSYISKDQIIKDIFPLFELKFYFNDTILTKNQKKLILPISGTIIKSKYLAKEISFVSDQIGLTYSKKDFLINGYFNTESVTIDVNIMYNLIGDETIVLECEWEILLPKLITNDIFKIYKINPLDLIQTLRKISLYKYLCDYKLFRIINSFREKKYRPGQIILKDGPKSNIFYYIYSGDIKININKVDFKTLTKGKCFGDISSENKTFSQITNFISNTNSILFTIDKDTYEEIVNKSDFFLNLRKMINLNDSNITLESLYFLNEIGRGSYGKVYLVHNKKKLFALKTAEINQISLHKEKIVYYINEKIIMQQVQHPFIVHLNNTFKTRDYIFFIMEFVNGISMREYLNNRNKKQIRNLEEVKFYGAILFNVLHYLTQRKIIHRDIKPDNLMINTNGYIKVIDFGIAKYLMKDYTNTIIGTPHYMSPEVILGKPYSFSVDYWSTGIVLYEIFYGRVPFGYDINDIKDIYKDIIEGNLILPSDQKNESFNNLISLLLNKNSSNRISNFINIKKHSFFENFHFDDLLEFKYKSFYQPKSNLEFSEEELLKNCNVSLLNFMRNHIYQSFSDIDENFLKESLINELNDF